MKDMSDKTFKQLTYGIMMIYILFFVAFIIYDIALRPSTEVPVSSPGGGWVLQPIVDSLFISLVGLTFLIYGIANAIVVWTRTADEYAALLSKMSIGRIGKRWISMSSSPYWLWQNRLLTPIMVVMGLFVFCVGMYSLLRHF